MATTTSKKATTENKKSRYWTFLVYPDSAPDDWEDILAGYRYCYKLHDHDVVKSTGKPKKDHIHVLLAFEGPTTYNTVKQLTDSLNSPIPQPARSVRGMIRYLIHADNKNKYQYKREDIVSVGMDQEIEQAFAVKKSDDEKKMERVKNWEKVMDIINDQQLTSWKELDNVLKTLGDPDLIDYAANHAYLVTQHLNENWHQLNRERCEKIK